MRGHDKTKGPEGVYGQKVGDGLARWMGLA